MGPFVALVSTCGTEGRVGALAAPVLSAFPFGQDRAESDRFSYVQSRTLPAPAERSESKTVPHRFLCVADVRLDHRNDLVRTLAPSPRGARASDAELILLAYEQWGDACADRLRGDFAFVIWDNASRSLFGASDPMGVRGLRYCLTDTGSLVVGSRSKVVAANLAPRPAMNTSLLRAYLQSDFSRWATETAYDSVHRLPPGYSLTFREGRVSTQRYCRIGDRGREEFQSDDDYVGRYGELLDRSVRSCLRAAGPVAASLSGGLDSSAIVGLAARQIAQNGGPPLRTYSFVFPNTPEADEAEYQREVLRAWPDVRGTAIPADDLWSFKGAFGPYAGREDEPNRWASQRALVDTMAERAASDGARVLLMGTFSDETLGTRTGLELLTSTSPWSWPEELRRLTAVRGFKGAAVEAAKAIKHRYFASPANRLAVLGPLARPSLGSFTADLSYLALFGGGKLLTRIASASRGDRTGLEVRFPFLDRDLVEFALALPVSLRLRGDRVSHKFVLRESMRGILPESVRDRRTKANVSHLDVLGFDREKQVMRQVAARSLAISSGWISESDADRLQLAAFGGLSGRRVNSMLTRLLEIETFLHEAHD